MARPFLNDLAWKMVETVRSGLSRRQTAEFFKVSISYVIKLMQQVDATDDVAPARFGGFKALPFAQREADMGAWIEERSDIVLAELQTKLEATGTTSSLPSLVRCLQRLGLPRKKDCNRCHAHSRRCRRSASQMR